MSAQVAAPIVINAQDNAGLTGLYASNYANDVASGNWILRWIHVACTVVFHVEGTSDNVIDQQYRFPRDITVGHDGTGPSLAAGEAVR